MRSLHNLQIRACIFVCVSGVFLWTLLAYRSIDVPPHVPYSPSQSAARVNGLVGSSTLAYLREGEVSRPDYEFLFYLGRIVHPVRPKPLLDGRIPLDLRPHYIITRADSLHDLSSISFHLHFEFQTDTREHYQLWKQE